jgi:hypothetical protein
MKVSLLPPSLVFYVKQIDKDNIVHGATNGFIIRINNKYKNDKGLLAHELEHVKQFWTRGGIIHLLMYQFWTYYRFRCELFAYIKQWTIDGGSSDLKILFVKRIFLCYKLNYSIEYIMSQFNKYRFYPY